MRLPTRSVLLRVGAVASAAVTSLTLGAAPAHADVVYQKRWFATGHSADGIAYGSWHPCGSVTKAKKASHLTCTQSSSTTVSVTMSITGTQEVGDSSLSAEVGYTVAKTQTVSIAYSVDVPAGGSTTIYYRTTSYRTKVKQQACDVVVQTGRCSDAYYGTTYAYTHKFRAMDWTNT